MSRRSNILQNLGSNQNLYASQSGRDIMPKQAFKFCFCFKRMFRLKMAEPPEDIKYLFRMYSENGTMSVEQLHRFLVECQEERDATMEDAYAIFNSLKHLMIFQRRGLHLDGFFKYLMGDLNPALASLEVHHDMNAPLAHYFLYTGHNSYLTGNQLSSNSSTEPIINALRRGVRVIELDLWPNSKGTDVDVRHGGTLTSSVKLIKCLQAIKENAFVASEYPVIITFEDHLDSKLQFKVAPMVVKTFGEMLYIPESEFPQEFPSPESLKMKVMISTKPPQESLDSIKPPETSINIIDSPGNEGATRGNKFDAPDKNEVEDEEYEEMKAPEYTRLIAIHSTKLKGGLENLLTIDSEKVGRLSLSEQKLENAVKTHGTNIVRFTQRNLLRVYPRGSRILSSNYDPCVGWTHGAQMVAFNMQGYGRYLWVMQGMFRANGNCGYYKKPDILLNIDPFNEVFNPSSRGRDKITTLKVKVYMGDGWHLDFRRTHFDPFSPPDFFTRLQILGVLEDSRKEKTSPIEDQWVPIWNKEFEFPLTVPELALLLIEVREFDTDRRHGFGGQTCFPVSELRSGIRSVPLYDQKGNKYKHVKLLMRFEFI